MIFIFDKENIDIFDAIKSGEKKVETRACSPKYQKIENGDEICFKCEGQEFFRKVKKVSHFKSIDNLLSVYKPEEINPKLKTKKEVIDMYNSFSGYKEKIKIFGIVALELC